MWTVCKRRNQRYKLLATVALSHSKTLVTCKLMPDSTCLHLKALADTWRACFWPKHLQTPGSKRITFSLVMHWFNECLSQSFGAMASDSPCTAFHRQLIFTATADADLFSLLTPPCFYPVLNKACSWVYTLCWCQESGTSTTRCV